MTEKWIVFFIAGSIPANQHITQNQRSRLAALRIDDVISGDDVTRSENSVDSEGWSIDTDSSSPESETDASSSSQASVETTATTSEPAPPESTPILTASQESTPLESTTLESASMGTMSLETTSLETTSLETTSLETTSLVTASTEASPVTPTEAVYSVAYDDSPWMPIYVRPSPGSAAETVAAIPEASTASAPITYNVSSIQSEEESTPTPPTLSASTDSSTVSTDSDDSGDSSDSGDSGDSGIVDDVVATTSKPSGNKKFSFLEWFGAQLASAEQNHKASNASAPRSDLPVPTSEQPITSSTRFFTLRPTAISYSGVRPLLRPRPQTPAAVTDASEPEGGLSDFPVESPRNQKSLNVSDEVGFFPPMRRPSSASNARPQPPAIDNSSADASSNSPIYTFILNKGQSVQDVLTQLLADLTTVESPADLHIDAQSEAEPKPEAEPEVKPEVKLEAEPDVEPEASTTIPEDEQPDNKAIAGDVRLQSWNGDAPFRPSILNGLIRTPASAIHPEATNSSSGKLLINSPLDLSKWNFIYIFI